jgi:glyoxylase-like metal-dependent hydrolase (beta-lactamase superfamily II)
MEYKIQRIGGSLYVIIGPEGATNFSILKANDNAAILVDADIRRIDEIQEALTLTGCTEVKYLVNTHEHFDHTSANFYFNQQGVPIVASQGCVEAMKEDGEQDFKRMLVPLPAIYDRFPGLKMTVPEVVFADATRVTLPGVTLHLKYCAQNGHSHSKGDRKVF